MISACLLHACTPPVIYGGRQYACLSPLLFAEQQLATFECAGHPPCQHLLFACGFHGAATEPSNANPILLPNSRGDAIMVASRLTRLCRFSVVVIVLLVSVE
jgi:hypothetical protein